MDEPKSKYAEVCEFLETVEQCQQAHPNEPLKDERIDKYKAVVDRIIEADSYVNLCEALDTITIDEAKYLSEQIYGLKTTYTADILLALRNAVFANAPYAVKKYHTFVPRDLPEDPWQKQIAALFVHAIRHKYTAVAKYFIENIYLSNWGSSHYIYHDMILQYGTFDLFQSWMNHTKFKHHIEFLKWQLVVEAENLDILKHIPELELPVKSVDAILNTIVVLDSIKCFEAIPLSFWITFTGLSDLFRRTFAYMALKIIDKLYGSTGDVVVGMPPNGMCFPETWDKLYKLVNYSKESLYVDAIYYSYPGKALVNKILHCEYLELSSKTLLSLIIVMIKQQKIDHLHELLKDIASPLYKVFHTNLNIIEKVTNATEMMYLTNKIIDIPTFEWKESDFHILRIYLNTDPIKYRYLNNEIKLKFAEWIIINNESAILEKIVYLDDIFRSSTVYNVFRRAIQTSKYEVVEILLKSYDYGLHQFNPFRSLNISDEKMMMLLLSYYNANNNFLYCEVDLLSMAIIRRFPQAVKYLLSINYRFKLIGILKPDTGTISVSIAGDLSINYSTPVDVPNNWLELLTTDSAQITPKNRCVKSYAFYLAEAIESLGKLHEITRMLEDFIDNYEYPI